MLTDSVFEIQPGVHAHFGCGSIEKLGRAVRATERDRAFVVSDPGVERAGWVARARRVLEADGIHVEVDVAERRPLRAERLASLVARLRTDPPWAVVALGGGSVIDTAKVAALLAASGGNPSDYPPGCRPARPAWPLVAVPTTAGAGAETTSLARLVDPKTHRTLLVEHSSLRPAGVILDPELAVTLPPRETAASAFVALANAIEAFTSSRHNPFADALALRAVAALSAYLTRAHGAGADLEARAELCLGAHLAGLAAASSGVGLAHAMTNPLAARLDVTVGQGLAALLPHTLRFAFEVCEARYAQLAIALGVAAPGVSDAENAHRAIAEVERLAMRVGLHRPLGELGVARHRCSELADDAMAETLLAGTPRFPVLDDVLAIYEAAL